MTGVEIKPASPADLDALRALSVQCFPPEGRERNPIPEQMLCRAVDDGHVFVAFDGDVVVGFIHLQRPSDHHIYVVSLAVGDGHRRQGVGTKLLRRVLPDASAVQHNQPPSVSTETSPTNEAMLGLLFANRFVGRRVMRGVDRGRETVYCQYKRRTDYIDPDVHYVVDVEAWEDIDNLLNKDHHVITGLTRTWSSRLAFEFSRFDNDDRAGLQANETSTSVNFAGTILAAITFVLGISLTSASFPNAARVLLLVSALATTMALVIYTNALGGISRLRFGGFDKYMRTGNVLSEYGGVHPFLISLPVTFSYATGSLPAGAAMGLLYAVSLLLYEWSHFSISNRFTHSIGIHVLRFLIGLAPLAGVFAIRSGPTWSWIWIASLLVVLTLLAILMTLDRLGELGSADRSAGWVIRE